MAGYGDLDDRGLVERYVAGDPGAFGELVHRHRDRLWSVALRTLGHPQDAEEALQEALIAAMRGAHSYRAEAAVTTWLHRIVVNACLDRVRRNKVRQADPLPAEPAGAVRAADLEGALDLMAALRLLSAEQRSAVVLVDMYGYSVEDCADLLGIPVGTVKSRCGRARLRLRTLLAGNPDVLPGVPSTERPEPGSPVGTSGGEGR